MNTKKILIIEDERDLRQGIKGLLGNDNYTFAEADNGEKGLALLTDETDLVILDIMMPGMDGIEVCKRIRQASSVPVLFLSAKAREEDILAGLTSGGDDYLTKPFSYTELNARVKALLRRYCVYRRQEVKEAVHKPDFIEIDNIRISLTHNEVLIKNREIDLTETEYRLLLLMMKQPNRSHSAAMLFEEIWKEPYYYGANRTVMGHIKKLRRKIEADPQNPVHIITVWGKGYQFKTNDAG